MDSQRDQYARLGKSLFLTNSMRSVNQVYSIIISLTYIDTERKSNIYILHIYTLFILKFLDKIYLSTKKEKIAYL